VSDRELLETGKPDTEDEVKHEKRTKRVLFDLFNFFKFKSLRNSLDRVGLFLKQLWNYFKTHRLVSLIVASGAAATILLLVLILNRSSSVEITSGEASQTQIQYSRVTVEVPKGAYAGEKSFQVIEVKEGTQEYLKYKELAGFEGPIYKIIPTDGRDELALKPIKIRYKIDPSVYPGDEFVHFVLRYVTLKDPPVVSTISGCEVRGESGRYIEGLAFHTSFVVGLAFKKPEYADFGIKLAVDRPPSLKPDLLIIPGLDQNFTGVIPNTQTHDNPAGSNLWGLLFPDRTVWVYKYPLITTRPRNYTRALEKHFRTSSVPSYISFEAKRLAAELKRLSLRTFDVIAQGIGGLIVRYALESDPTITNVRSLVLLSVPNKGTNVTNPIYLSSLYGRPVENLGEIFGIEKDDMAFLISSLLGTLEKTNAYWSEILPSSLVIAKLEEFGMRKDVRYLFVGGRKPPGKIQIAGTELEKFFPEFVDGKGDGFTTIDSAIPVSGSDNVKTLLFPYSFQDLYLKNDVLQALKDFLKAGIEIPTPPEFETDQFVERKVSEKTTSTSVEWHPYLLSNLEPGRILELLWRMEVPSLGYPVETLKGLYLVGKSGVFMEDTPGNEWKKVVATAPLSFEVLSDGSLLLCYESYVEIVSGDSVVSKLEFNINGVLSDAYFADPSRGILIAETATGPALLWVEGGRIKTMSTLKNAYAELKPSGNLLLLITDSGIQALDRTSFEKRWELREDSMVKRLGLPAMSAVDPVDAEIVGKELFVLFRDYTVGVFHLNSTRAQVIASGETGAKRLINSNDRVFVVGENSITGFNVSSHRRFPYYQEIHERFWWGAKDKLLSTFEEGGKTWLAAYSFLF